MQEQATTLPETSPEAPVTSYAYKQSLIGAAHRFELTEQGLFWRFGGRTGVWPYEDIASIRLSYRPVSMQAHRFRADISNRDGGRLPVLSTSWQTAALMAPQDNGYRGFVTGLHARLAQAGSTAELTGGLGRSTYTAALALLALVGAMLTVLFLRALLTGEFAGALFFVGFAALFAWQVGGFVRRNRPVSYSFDHIPEELLP
jgi:hypothetical protein